MKSYICQFYTSKAYINQRLFFHNSIEADLLFMHAVQRLLVVSSKLIEMDQTLVRLEFLPLGLLTLAGEGEDVDGDAQDIG